MLSIPCLNVYSSSDEEYEEDVELSVQIVDNVPSHSEVKKTPFRKPTVHIFAHQLLFVGTHPDYILILEKNGLIEYTKIIMSTESISILPSYLHGEFNLRLLVRNYCFYGHINLF